jgi:hypothetical protein
MHWADYRSLTSPTDSSDEAHFLSLTEFLPRLGKCGRLLLNLLTQRVAGTLQICLNALTHRHISAERQAGN